MNSFTITIYAQFSIDSVAGWNFWTTLKSEKMFTEEKKSNKHYYFFVYCVSDSKIYRSVFTKQKRPVKKINIFILFNQVISLAVANDFKAI